MPHRAALAGLAALVGWPDSEATAAVFRNDDPVLRTRYRVGAAAAAALAAGAMAADRLRAARWTTSGRTSRSTCAMPPPRCAAAST